MTTDQSMKFFSLFSALILSVVPVQASKTPEEIMKPCDASEAAMEACLATGVYFSAIVGYTVLCSLRDTGEMTPKVFAEREKNSRNAVELDYEKVMWNEGVKSVLEDYPNCPIQPIR